MGAPLLLLLEVAAGFGPGGKKATAAPPPPPLITEEMMVAVGAALAVLALGYLLMNMKPSGPKPTCSLVFNKLDECLHAVWHMSDLTATANENETVLATFTPTVPVSQYKMTHNCGRSELARGVSTPKSFYSGWLQFVTLAYKTGAAPVKFAQQVPGRGVLLSAVDSESLVRKCSCGGTLSLKDVEAAAVTNAAATEFNVKYFDRTQFELLGGQLGCAINFTEAPGMKPGVKSPIRRQSTRSDMVTVERTSSFKEAMN